MRPDTDELDEPTDVLSDPTEESTTPIIAVIDGTLVPRRRRVRARPHRRTVRTRWLAFALGAALGGGIVLLAALALLTLLLLLVP